MTETDPRVREMEADPAIMALARAVSNRDKSERSMLFFVGALVGCAFVVAIALGVVTAVQGSRVDHNNHKIIANEKQQVEATVAQCVRQNFDRRKENEEARALRAFMRARGDSRGARRVHLRRLPDCALIPFATPEDPYGRKHR